MSTGNTQTARLTARITAQVDKCLMDNEGRLRALQNMAGRIPSPEFSLITLAAEKSLQTLNFSTRLVMRGKRCAIEASARGNAKLLVLIEDACTEKGVGFKTDWANLADKSCLKMQDEFEEKMAGYGVELYGESASEDVHLDPRGGQLIRNAGQMHAENLAAGIVLYEEQAEQFCRSLYSGESGQWNPQKDKV